MTRRVTLGDVAERAGVHKATVSRALNERTQHQVNPETLRKVKRAARDLGYQPDAVARSLRTASTMTVGVIIPDLMNPIFPPLVRGIEHHLQPQGYTALLANTDGDPDVEAAAFASLSSRRVDGFILATGRREPQAFLAAAHERGIAVVMANREAGGVPFPVVMADNAMGETAAVEHLVGLGHRRIVHLAGPASFSTTRTRAQAFAAATAAAGVEGRTIPDVALTIRAGEDAMDELLERSETPPTAVVAGNDLVALGAIHALRRRGLDCPRDVSVVGFNDMPFAGDFWPPLTTVRVPLRDIGIESARALLTAIGSERRDSVTITLPVSLVVRGSTGPVG